MKIVEAHKVKLDVMRYAFFERNHMAVVTEGLRNADVVSITGNNKFACEFEIKVSKSDLDKELAAIKYAVKTMKEGKKLGPSENDADQAALNLELAGLKQKAGGWSKVSKHEEYIDPKAYFEKHRRYMFSQSYIPNYFYIVVPDRLTKYAMAQTEGTGYGVIAYDGCRQEGKHYGYYLNGQWHERWTDHPKDAVWQIGAPCSRDCIKGIAVRSKAKLIHKDPLGEGALMSILNRAVTENIRMLGEIIRLNERLENASSK